MEMKEGVDCGLSAGETGAEAKAKQGFGVHLSTSH